MAVAEALKPMATVSSLEAMARVPMAVEERPEDVLSTPKARELETLLFLGQSVTVKSSPKNQI